MTGKSNSFFENSPQLQNQNSVSQLGLGERGNLACVFTQILKNNFNLLKFLSVSLKIRN